MLAKEKESIQYYFIHMILLSIVMKLRMPRICRWKANKHAELASSI
jgi:hypothetical protein